MKESINFNDFEYVGNLIFRTKSGDKVLITTGSGNILLKSDSHISVVVNPDIIATNSD